MIRRRRISEGIGPRVAGVFGAWIMISALSLSAETKSIRGAAIGRTTDEFFIVSSVDPASGTMVLKRPTEVTLTMRVSEKTRFSGEDGKPMRASDLRAGDTVFIAFSRDGSGAVVASTVRQGIMTVPELQRRYLRPGR
jgi:hypothetical protein